MAEQELNERLICSLLAMQVPGTLWVYNRANGLFVSDRSFTSPSIHDRGSCLRVLHQMGGYEITDAELNEAANAAFQKLLAAAAHGDV